MGACCAPRLSMPEYRWEFPSRISVRQVRLSLGVRGYQFIGNLANPGCQYFTMTAPRYPRRDLDSRREAEFAEDVLDVPGPPSLHSRPARGV
jgi:hypothetical protein